MKEYKIVYCGGEGEIVEKKSRFIATVKPVDSEEEASAFIAEYLTVSVKALFAPQ